MRQIVCFGDSNTYGLIPKEGGRYPWGIRWTSRLNERLGLDRYRVVDCVAERPSLMISFVRTGMAVNGFPVLWRPAENPI